MEVGRIISAVMELSERANSAEMDCIEWLRCYSECDAPSKDLIERAESFSDGIRITIESLQDRVNKSDKT